MKSLLWLMLIGCLSMPAEASNEVDLNSPIKWGVRITDHQKSKTYENKNVAEFLRNGVKNKDIKVSCSFGLKKGFSEKLTTQKNESIGGEYKETISFVCVVGGVFMELKEVSCTESKSHVADIDVQRVNFPDLEIMIMCTSNSWLKK
jgi:hypothetical protein